MFDETAIAELRREHPQRQFLIHDGFDGWAYGTPCNARQIADNLARQLLSIAATRESPSRIWDQLNSGTPAIQYAECGDVLYAATKNNRFLAFVFPDQCLTRDEHDNATRGPLPEPPLDLDLGQ
jgi:hypothetical protein